MLDELYRNCLKLWGEEGQLTVLQEEASEVIKEVCKRRRGYPNQQALIEEIADLTIILDQFKEIWGVEIATMRAEKILRLQETVNKELERRSKSDN